MRQGAQAAQFSPDGHDDPRELSVVGVGHGGPATSSHLIRVLVADAAGLVRAGFRALLEGEADISVTAEAASGQDAVMLAKQSRPDVVLMDIRLPGLDGLEATRRILAEPDLSDVKILIVTTNDRYEDLVSALRAGASGFLSKDTEPVDLLRAVRAVAAGQVQLSASATRFLIEEFASVGRPEGKAAEVLQELTAREL